MAALYPGGYVKKFDSAHQLPAEWDTLTFGYFQSRAFLDYNEQYNPCHQRYYLAYDDSGAQAAAVAYTISVDLFTFSNIPSPLRMHVIGLPVSVSLPGIFGRKSAVEQLIGYLLQEEKGLIAGLNLPVDTYTGNGIKLRMLPTLELPLAFKNWENYLEELRAPYRRRCRQIADKWNSIRIEKTSCVAFTDQHYHLYLDVLKHSTTKLETLTSTYLKNLPDNFQLITYFLEDEILSWHITCTDHSANCFYFFFGGHNYRYNHETDAYFNNLLGVLKEGIETGLPRIDFGQTAEIPKMRLGGSIVPKALFVYHRNPVVFWFLQKLKWLIEYRKPLAEHHVFKHPIALNHHTV